MSISIDSLGLVRGELLDFFDFEAKIAKIEQKTQNRKTR